MSIPKRHPNTDWSITPCFTISFVRTNDKIICSFFYYTSVFYISFIGDSNIAVRNDMVNIVEQPLQKATQHLQESLQIQCRTRASLHEMPRYLHQLSVALVGLQDRLPTICNAKIVPETKGNWNKRHLLLNIPIIRPSLARSQEAVAQLLLFQLVAAFEWIWVFPFVSFWPIWPLS